MKSFEENNSQILTTRPSFITDNGQDQQENLDKTQKDNNRKKHIKTNMAEVQKRAMNNENKNEKGRREPQKDLTINLQYQSRINPVVAMIQQQNKKGVSGQKL